MTKSETRITGKRKKEYVPELLLRSRINNFGAGEYILEIVLVAYDNGVTKLQLVISVNNVYCFSVDLVPYSLELFDQEDYFILATLTEIHALSYQIGEYRLLDMLKRIISSSKSKTNNDPFYSTHQLYHIRRIFQKLCSKGVISY